MTFDRGELLREAGYSDGDVIPLAAVNGSTGRFFSTTSTSYSTQRIIDFRVRWDRLVPDDSQGVVSFAGQANPRGSESGDYRMFNVDDSGTALEQTDFTANKNVDPGWIEYSPATTSSPVELVLEARTDPGNDAFRIFDPVFLIGVQL